jgi:ABC-type uncharacterized transport system permease subunit
LLFDPQARADALIRRCLKLALEFSNAVGGTLIGLIAGMWGH